MKKSNINMYSHVKSKVYELKRSFSRKNNTNDTSTK